MAREEAGGTQGDEAAAGDDEKEAQPAQPLLDGLHTAVHRQHTQPSSW